MTKYVPTICQCCGAQFLWPQHYNNGTRPRCSACRMFCAQLTRCRTPVKADNSPKQPVPAGKD